MGAASRRKRERAAQAAQAGGPDIHEQIAREAEQARAKDFGLAWGGGYPALRQLLLAARSQVALSTPLQIEFEGRTYWCRVSHGMSVIELFDSPATVEPLARTICGSSDFHGHEPAR